MAFKETFSINGEQVLQKVKELIKDGNVTKISISDKNNKEIMSFPVNVGLIGLVFAPVFAAIGTLAALVTECKITVERKDEQNGKNDVPDAVVPNNDV